jgi:NAD-dependent dihydropyrimidine dehydrogenase PreA subunit
MKLRGIRALMMKRANIDAMDELESSIAARPEVVHPTERSPQRFDIVRNALQMPGVRPPMTLRTAPHMLSSRRGILRSLREIAHNPAQPKTQIEPKDLAALEQYAQSLGVEAVGYARLPRHLIFQNKAVLYDNAIVLVMEMDKTKIEAAPGPKAGEAVHETYHYLGDAANRLAGYLRKRGYASHAGPPLNGLVLYPPLAQLAGLGWRGRHGMLITSQFGPRMRLAAVYSSIQNLPFFEGPNEHRWIEGYCATCGQCIRRCPTQAILEAPIERENGLVKCVEVDKCFPYFVETLGCSVCIKVCPFNRQGYDAIKARFLQSG